MDARELLQQGNLSAALEKLQEQVRSDPANVKHRIFLFQLLCVLGRWDRALVQLNLAAEMDAKCVLMAQACRPAIQCEALRSEVFAGRRQPLIFGEPPEWVGWLLQAAQLDGAGRHAQAAPLRQRAFDTAPAVPGAIDGRPFAWLADADPRLGPMLEAIIEGRYFWVPLVNVRLIRIETPTDLRDVVWCPATFTWANGGSSVAFIPGRYPGSESHEDAAVQLGRRTQWTTQDGLELPVGQRLLATDEGEYPLLEVRVVSLGEQSAGAEAQ